MKRTDFVFVALLLLNFMLFPLHVSAGDEHDDDGHDHHEHGHHEEGNVRLKAETLEQAGIWLERVRSAQLDSGLELFGEIRPDGDKLAHIVPRFAGVVREVKKIAGDTVKAGDVLAIIESNESLTPYELKTLLDGTVIAKHITRGEAVDRDKRAFIIADLSQVWAELAVYPKDLEQIHVGQKAVVTDGDALHVQEGVLSYLTPTVDEPTRTIRARIALDNANGSWRLGTFITARLLTSAPVPTVVHKSAIQTIEGKSVVFVQSDDALKPRPVVVGRIGESLAEIINGVSADEHIAVGNTFILKAELGKESAEHQH